MCNLTYNKLKYPQYLTNCLILRIKSIYAKLLFSCLEYASYEAVQMRVYGVIAVVTVLNDVPYVRNTVLVEVIVVALGSVEAYDVVLSTACYHQEIGLL